MHARILKLGLSMPTRVVDLASEDKPPLDFNWSKGDLANLSLRPDKIRDLGVFVRSLFGPAQTEKFDKIEIESVMSFGIAFIHLIVRKKPQLKPYLGVSLRFADENCFAEENFSRTLLGTGDGVLCCGALFNFLECNCA